MKNFLLAFFLIIGLQSFSQSPWLWAKTSKGTGTDLGLSVATDQAGNVYAAGAFSSSTLVLGTYTLTNALAPYWDIFLVKYDSIGKVIWAKSAGGIDNDGYNGVGIGTDSLGNVYLAAGFQGSPFVIGSFSLTSTGLESSFIAKYDSSGNVVWTRNTQSTSVGWVEANVITVDALGNQYITGHYKGSNEIFGTDTLKATSSADIFISKVTSSGNVVWSKCFGGKDQEDACSIKVDAFGNIYLTGRYFSDSLIFGNDTLLNSHSNAMADIYIVKIDTSGNNLWAKTHGGPGYNPNAGRSLAIDEVGNVYLTGSFSSTSMNFDNYVLFNQDPNSCTGYITKYNGNGNVIWAKSFGTAVVGNSISTDKGGHFYVSGTFGYYVTFPPLSFYQPPAASNPLYFVKFDTSGFALSGVALQSGSGSGASFVTVDVFGNSYLCSVNTSDSLVLGSDTLFKTGNGNLLLAKFNKNYVMPLCITSVSDSLINISPLNWSIIPNYSSQVVAAIWHWGDGTSTNALYPSHTYTAQGWYNICVMVYTSCGDSSSACRNDSIYRNVNNGSMVHVNVVQNPNSIDQIENEENQLSIYPNPSNGSITVEGHTELGTVTVYNALGEVVYQRKTSATELKIDISKQNSGVYILEVSGEHTRLLKE